MLTAIPKRDALATTHIYIHSLGSQEHSFHRLDYRIQAINRVDITAARRKIVLRACFKKFAIGDQV